MMTVTCVNAGMGRTSAAMCGVDLGIVLMEVPAWHMRFAYRLLGRVACLRLVLLGASADLLKLADGLDRQLYPHLLRAGLDRLLLVLLVPDLVFF